VLILDIGEDLMIISCPQCKTEYIIDAALIPLSGKKMRCAKCSEIWRAYPQDWQNFENTLLKEHEETEEKITTCRSISGGFFKTLLKMAAFLLIVTGIIYAYIFRYEIVEIIPAFNPVYDTFNIEARTVGDGLMFKDITWNEYEDSKIRKMDVSGKIINKTGKMLHLPLLHIELLDSEGTALQSVNRPLASEYIAADGEISFKTTINDPPAFTKYIYITFTRPN